MNDFANLAKLAKERKARINAFYEQLDQENLSEQILLKALQASELKNTQSTRLAILRRFVDLKEESLNEEFKKAGFSDQKSAELKKLIFGYVKEFYEKEHYDFITEAQKQGLLEPFYQELLKGVHDIGMIINDFQIAWNECIIETNNKELAQRFSSLKQALDFLHTHKLYQTDSQGQKCERAYGALSINEDKMEFLPYALAFKDEIASLDLAFEKLLQRLEKLAFDDEHKNYIDYLFKLRKAFCQKDNSQVISSWQEAELAWLKIKSPLQLAHPLEYYEDNYTHAVALEWDIRLNDSSNFKSEEFKAKIRQSFCEIYKQGGFNDTALLEEVLLNIDRTQLYICMPIMFYGAELNGLFSAQVVPNDEFVSKLGGKKIFTFLNFVYENAKNKPFMRLASEVFEKDFLDYGREILFFKEELWKKVYEISTIGHEFGHIYFIGQQSELKMNQSGVFKNIEEFKATAGGLMSFFLHEEEELKLPVFYELIKRAVGLIAWQQVEEVKPYYTEGLIHLSLLFQSEVLSFKAEKLSIDFSLGAYDRFKQEFIKAYFTLANVYVQRLDAKEFLTRFCVLENGVFLPIEQECKAFVKYYYELHEKIGNQIDQSGEFQRYKKAIQAKN